jgi:uncharacterized protein YndB with AHSA1/START domain
MSRPPRGYLQTLETAASPQTVWRALVEPRALALWYAGEAHVEPRAGGHYAAQTRTLGRREALIDIFEPGRRLRLIYSPNPAWPQPGPAVLVEDFLVDGRGDRTVLRLLGSGVPAGRDWDPVLQRLKAAWMVSFNHLQRRLEAGEISESAA